MALGRLGERGAIAALTPLLHDESQVVREAAWWALKRIRDLEELWKN